MTEPTPTAVQSSQRRMMLIGVLMSVMFVLGIVALLLLRTQLSTTVQPTPTLSSGVTLIDPPIPLTSFTLPGKNGQPLSLSDLAGSYTLLFFGYTHCPDFCPLTLADFKRIKAELGDQADQVQFLFVSVDGARDTPEMLNEYINRFDPTFYAMQGDEATLSLIQPEYGLFYQLQKTGEDDLDYPVDHTTRSYILDPSTQMVGQISFGTEVSETIEALRALMG